MKFPGWLDTVGEYLLQAIRYLWLNVYALLALVLGVVFVAYVPQSREIFANLVTASVYLSSAEAERNSHAPLFLVSLVIWGLSVWYSMRVLSSTRFPADPEPFPSTRRFAEWMNRDLPRVSAFAGLGILAVITSMFLGGEPDLRTAVVLAIGIAPLTWAAMHVVDLAIARNLAGFKAKDYLLEAVLVGVIALALALNIWWSLPHDWKDRGLLALLGYSRNPAGELGGQFNPALVPGISGGLLIASVAAMAVAAFLRRHGVRISVLSAALLFWVGGAFTGPLGKGIWLPLVVLAAAIAGLWWTSRRRRIHRIQEEDPGKPRQEVGQSTRRALSMAIVALVVLIVGFSNAPITIGNWLGTLAIVFLALSLWCFFGTALWVLLPKRRGWTSLAAIPLLWAIFIGQSANHELRDTQIETPKRYSYRPTLWSHFERWRAQLPDRDNSPIFFVSAAGGGLRAGFWTASLLAAMDDRTCGEFGRHVYAVSGVSGGSLGLTAYLAQRQVWSAKSPAERCGGGRVDEITRMLGRDFLAPVSGSLLFAEAFQLFMPISYLENERGTTLANAWSGAWDDTFGKIAKGRFAEPFLSVFQASPESLDSPGASDPAAKILPAIFLNATGVKSGRRVIASNVRSSIPGSDDLFYASMVSRAPRLQTYGLSVAEAVLNSARFTYVSPAGTVMGCYPDASGVPEKCESSDLKVWDRVVDGGYFENSGLTTLLDVMNLLEADEPQDRRKYKNPVFIIIIDNGEAGELACASPPRRYDLRGGMPAHVKSAESLRKLGQRMAPGISMPAGKIPPLSETTAPIEALLNVREARARLEVRRVGVEFHCANVLDWSLFGNPRDQLKAARAKQQPALGWFLSTRSAEWMLSRAQQYADGLPFDLAACDDGARPTRGLLGDPGIKPASCPEVVIPKPRAPLVPGLRNR